MIKINIYFNKTNLTRTVKRPVLEHIGHDVQSLENRCSGVTDVARKK